MATYKQPCIHCQAMLEKDARFCPSCGKSYPFGYACPDCLREIEKGQALCAGCGRPLYINCPHCGRRTFVTESCEVCGKPLTVVCPHANCGAMQFFENQKCTVCGKKMQVKKSLFKKKR